MVFYEPEKVKGFPEFLPPESQQREQVKKIVQNKFELFGFLPIETPSIEYDELMQTGLEEDEAVSDRFRLKDRAGRNLGLRYEFTFQLARILKENPNIKMPFKRFQIGKNFRDEPTSSGRYKEFTQCDIDIIGDGSIKADAECLACFSSIFDELKLKVDLCVNNKKLLYSIIESVKIEQKNQIIKELDKLDKLGEDTIKSNMRKYADSNQILTLFKMLEKDLDFFVSNIFDGAVELKELIETLRMYGIKAKFTPTLARGLSYYTGNIFEMRLEGKNQSIAGGGRYDGLVGKYIKRELPAVGISVGLERLTDAVKIESVVNPNILISIEQDKETIKLAKSLRKNNIPITIMFGKTMKALEYADSYKANYAVFIGREEISAKKYKLKNLKTGEEKLLTEKQLTSKLKN